jgi:hypothetical protein
MILGIDPGPTHSAAVIYDATEKKVVWSTQITKESLSNLSQSPMVSSYFNWTPLFTKGHVSGEGPKNNYVYPNRFLLGLFNSYPHKFRGIDLCLPSLVLDYAAIESVEARGSHFGAVGQDTMNTALWAGIFLAIVSATRYLCTKAKVYLPREIKQRIVGQTAAKKDVLKSSVVDFFDPNRTYGKYGAGTKKNPGPLAMVKADCFNALAVAMALADELQEKGEGGVEWFM